MGGRDAESCFELRGDLANYRCGWHSEKEGGRGGRLQVKELDGKWKGEGELSREKKSSRGGKVVTTRLESGSVDWSAPVWKTGTPELRVPRRKKKHFKENVVHIGGF